MTAYASINPDYAMDSMGMLAAVSIARAQARQAVIEAEKPPVAPRGSAQQGIPIARRIHKAPSHARRPSAAKSFGATSMARKQMAEPSLSARRADAYLKAQSTQVTRFGRAPRAEGLDVVARRTQISGHELRARKRDYSFLKNQWNNTQVFIVANAVDRGDNRPDLQRNVRVYGNKRFDHAG